jgi:hypothetical protein
MKSWRFGQCDRSGEIKSHVSLRSADWESGGVRQKYVLDQITLYHFTPLRFSIKHADGLCPGNGEFFSQSPSVAMPTYNTLVFCIKASRKCFRARSQKKFKNWVFTSVFGPQWSTAVVQFIIQRVE